MSPGAKREARQPRQRRWPFVLIFLVGALVISYPLITRLYYETDAAQLVREFDDGRSDLSEEEIEERVSLAAAYNDALEAGALHDPYTEEQEAGVAEYARMLEVHERLGYVSVPKLHLEIPMYAGTSEVVLQKGIGHLEGTSLPIGGNSTHSVLTAHRGLPTARLFSELDQLVVGDKFYIHNIEGVIAYQVDQVKVIEPSDFSDLLVSPGHDYATLLTCTPYMINSHRLIVRGHRIDYVAAVEEQHIEEQRVGYLFKIGFYVAAGLFLITLFLALRGWFKRRALQRRIQTLEASRAQE